MNLSNYDILNLMKSSPYFIGVYSRDQLPPPPQQQCQLPVTLIVNTDTSNLDGVHWVTIFINKCRRGEYFDSFAQYPPNQIAIWLNRYTINWNCILQPSHQQAIQHPFTNVCGSYAVYFARQRPLVNSVNDILHCFDPSHRLKNDQVILSYIKTISSYMCVFYLSYKSHSVFRERRESITGYTSSIFLTPVKTTLPV